MDGNCLLSAVIGSCDKDNEIEGQKYRHHQLRLQVINHMVMQREMLFDELKEDIQMTYGALEDIEGGQGKGFSYKTYCLHMLKDGIWCDGIIMKAIASMWAAKITIVHADTFFESKLRHNGDLFNADIVVLFNGSYLHGHYISCVRTNGENFIIANPERDPDYNRESDRLERAQRQDFTWREEGEAEIMMLPMEVYNMLFYKAQEYDKFIALAKKKPVGMSSQPPAHPKLPSLQPDDDPKGGGGGGKKDGGDDDDEDPGPPGDPSDPTTKKRKGAKYQPEEKIPDKEIDEAISICPRCKKDQGSHPRLMTHIKKFHEDQFNFLCDTCDRGFITRVGWESHKKSHDKTVKRLKCPQGCTGSFIDKKSLANHKRKIHPVGGVPDLECEFEGCNKVFHTKANYKQHIMCCKKNPMRSGNEMFCHKCGKGGFFTMNKWQEHKRDVHGWR